MSPQLSVVKEEAPFSDETWGDTYGISVSCPPSESELAMMKALHLACERDPRFTAAARHHAETLIRSPGGISSGRMEHLRFTLQQLGGYDYRISTEAATPDSDGIERLKQKVGERSRRWTHCGLGIASGGGRSLAVLVGTRRTVDIAPIKNHIVPSGQLRFTARSRSGSGEIRLVVGHPDATAHVVDGIRDGADVTFEVRFDGAGRYDLEILHDTGYGLETVVLVPIFVGIEPDRRPTVVPDVPPADTDAPTALFGYLNSARTRSGAPPLARDSRLDEVAARHSRDMAAHRFFGHISPHNGGLVRRLSRAALAPKWSAENIAESATALRIHRNLMASPAHRINMLNSRYTHVGIGVASTSDGELIATQIYAAF